MPGRTRVVLVGLALVSLLTAAVPSGGWADLVQTLVQVSCVAFAWQQVRHRHVVRDGWGLLVLAVGLLGASDLVAALQSHLSQPQTRPALANVVALAGYLLLGLAALELDRNRSRGRPPPGSIEAAIFAAGLLTPLLVFVILPILAHPSISAGAKAVTTLYALADLVVVAVIARLLLTGGQSRSFAFLCAALFVSLAGDIWSWVTTIDDPSLARSLVRTLWLLAFVLFAAGVAHPSMQALTGGAAEPQDVPRSRRMWLMGLGQALPAIALLFAWRTAPPSSLLVIAVGGLGVSVLVSARMNGLLDQISEQSAQLSDLARSDELTGLHNRRSWNFELARACAAASAEGRLLSVALLDLDHFKKYNDSYGHPAGDRMLRAAAAAWQQAFGEGEVLARYGGEEFAVLLPGTGLAEAVQRLDSMRALTPGGQSFSAGVALWTAAGDPEQTVADADSALYDAKRQGRNRVLAYRPPGPRSQAQLPYALRTVVQPIVRVSDLAVVAYEALSRFDPSTDVEGIFSQAHDEGYGDLLEGTAVLSALRHPERPDDVDLFVNVSERAMSSRHFWASMPTRLDHVVVELHEVRHGLDDATIARMLDRFRDRGARVCLDDLVASPDDLNRIVSLRPDLVKVDRSLVAGCDTHPGQVADIDRLLCLARAHHVGVCAEGVETPAELSTLRDLGVTHVQGYLLGRPQRQWVEPLQPALRLGQLPGQGRGPGTRRETGAGPVTRTSAR